MVTRKSCPRLGKFAINGAKGLLQQYLPQPNSCTAANSTRADVLSDHASKGNPTYCSANDAWACSEACR